MVVLKNNKYVLGCSGVILLIVVLLIKDVWITFQSLAPVGIDGYYYVLQVDTWLANGDFYFSNNAPFILYFFVFLKIIIGNTVLAIKIGALLLEVLLLISIFLIIYEIFEQFIYGIFAVSLFLVSGLHIYLLAEYLNQLGATAFLLFGIFGILKFSKTKFWGWLFPSIVSVLLSFFSHRSIGAIILAGSFSLGVVIIFNYLKNNFKKNYSWVSLVIVLLTIFAPAILKIQHIFPLPQNLQSEITLKPEFPSHFATLPEIIILLILVPVILWVITFKLSDEMKNTVQYMFGSIALWSLFITLNPFITSSLGFISISGRLKVLAGLQVAMLLPVITFYMEFIPRYLRGGIITLSSLVLLWSFLSPLPFGTQSAYLTQRTALIKSVKDISVSKNSFIIADHGEQFVITALTGIASSQNFPNTSTNYETIYWLIKGMPETLIDDKMTPLFNDQNGKKTVLVRHDSDFEKRLLNSDVKRILTTANPHLFFYLNPLRVETNK